MLANYFKALHIIMFSFVIFFSLFYANDAYAQTKSCSSLSNSVRSLERNRDFRALAKNTQAAKNLQKSLKDTERKFVRTGCQKVLKAKKKLTGQCRSLARIIIRGRSDLKKLQVKISTGQTIARQREGVLKRIANNTCTKPSSATFNSIQNNNKSLFDILFGNDQRLLTTDAPNVRIDLNTIRTLCVRVSDGYYWPISFSTTRQYLAYDEKTCSDQSNGFEVELYYHKNPGEDADKMINLAGTPYKSLPNAFLYRREFVASDIFKKKTSSGFFELVKNETTGLARTMIMFEDQSFPMPIRDPRQKTKITVTEIAKAIFVPLPRARPYQEGEERPAQIIAAPKTTQPIKTFTSNGKTIRIIGPNTLYALSAPTDS